jgi:hypothetical protein
MADPPRYPENDEESGVGRDGVAASRTPRLGLVLGIMIVIALVVLVVALHLTGTLGPGAH